MACPNNARAKSKAIASSSEYCVAIMRGRNIELSLVIVLNLSGIVLIKLKDNEWREAMNNMEHSLLEEWLPVFPRLKLVRQVYLRFEPRW